MKENLYRFSGKSFDALATVKLINLWETIHKNVVHIQERKVFSGNRISSTKVRIFLRPMFNKLSNERIYI